MTSEVCPVCMGRGFVQQGFYSTTTGSWNSYTNSTEQCRSCKGIGYILIPAEVVNIGVPIKTKKK